MVNGDHMRDVLNRWACESLFAKQANGFVQIGATVLEVGCRATGCGNDALEEGCNGVSSPGIGHRHRHTAHVLKAGSGGSELVVLGSERQDSEDLARTECNAQVDHPDPAVGELGSQSSFESASRLCAHQGESGHPVDDGLGAGCSVKAKHSGKHSQHSRNRTKADAGHQEQLQGQVDQVHFGDDHTIR